MCYDNRCHWYYCTSLFAHIASRCVNYDRWSYKRFNRFQAVQFAIASVFNAVVGFYVSFGYLSEVPMILYGCCVGICTLLVWCACWGLIRNYQASENTVDFRICGCVVLIKLIELSIQSVTLSFLVKADTLTDSPFDKFVLTFCIYDIVLDGLGVLYIMLFRCIKCSNLLPPAYSEI